MDHPNHKNDLNKSKLELTDILRNNLRYKIYNPRNKQSDVYLYNLNSPTYQIVCVSASFNFNLKNYNFDNVHIANIKKNLLKKHQHLKINILYVIFQNGSQPTKVIGQNTILYTSSNTWMSDVAHYIPQVEKIFNNRDYEISSNMRPDELSEHLKNPNSKLRKDLKKLGDRSRLSNLIVVWFAVLFFVLLPFTANFVLIHYGLNIQGISDVNVIYLAEGATSHDAVFGAGQWWRIFTYVFSNGSNWVTLLILGIFIFIVAWYSEVIFKPWKIFITLVASILIYGFFMTVVAPNSVTAGGLIVVTSLYGLIYMGSYKDATLTGIHVRQKTILVPVLLVIYPLFTGNYYLYLTLFLGFVLGTAFAFTFKYNYNRISWTFYYPFFIIVPMIIIPLVIAVIPTAVIPPNNSTFFQTMEVYYYSNHYMSKTTIESIMMHYYHIPRDEIGQFITF